MAEILTGKIVTVSRPYLLKEGNSWVSTCVYKKGEEYFQKNAVPPTLKHGPWEVGEEVHITPSQKDLPAEDWMIEIYNNPKNYKEIMLLANGKKDDDDEDDGPDGITIFVNILITLAVLAIIGIILYTFIKGA